MEQDAVAVLTVGRRGRSPSSRRSVSTRKSFPFALWTVTSVLPFGVASMPFRLKPEASWKSPVSGTACALAAGLPFFESGRRYSTARLESVNHAARFVATTSFTNVAPPPVVSCSSRSERAGPCVVDEPLAGRAAGDEQPASVEASTPIAARPVAPWHERRSRARPEVAAVDRPGGDRADVEGRSVADRDSLRLPAVRQRDRVGERRLREGGGDGDDGEGRRQQQDAAHVRPLSSGYWGLIPVRALRRPFLRVSAATGSQAARRDSVAHTDGGEERQHPSIFKATLRVYADLCTTHSIITVEPFVQSATRAAKRRGWSCAARSRSRSRSPEPTERARSGRCPDRPMALGRSLLQDARRGNRRGARRSRAPQRRACEAREGRQGRRHSRGHHRRHALRGRGPRAGGETWACHRRAVALRRRRPRLLARRSVLPSGESPARWERISAPARQSRIVGDWTRSGAPSGAGTEGRASCSSGRAPGRRRSPPAARARPRRRRPRRCQARASGRRRRARGARTRREASRRRAPQHR